jgi:methylated-DNA-[protein]-cysteine S-methyltransferase
VTVFQTVDSPIGTLTLIGNGHALTGLFMNRQTRDLNTSRWRKANHDHVLLMTSGQLKEFFEGRRKEFDLPLEAEGTDFQKRCWNELVKIPFGCELSYGEVARRLGNPNASRAVGAANGQNPISIVVPCHRVVGATGKLVGFGGGLPRKAALLNFERAICFEELATEYWQSNPCELD